MANVPKFRFVRCPKCSKILMEIDDVPIYQCGGCGVTLHAKKHAGVAENSGSSCRESKKVDQSPGYGTSSNQLQRQIDPSVIRGSLKEHDQEQIRDMPKHLTEDSSRARETKARKSDEILNASQVQVEDLGHDETKGSFRDEVEENLKFSEDADIDKLEADNDSVTYNGLRSSTRSPQTIDGGSGSSLDDVRSSSSRKDYKLLSRRTFRSPNVQNSSGNKSKEGCRHVSTDDSGIQERNLTLKSQESHLSASSRSFYSKGRKFYQESSFNSTEFQSVQNWMDSPERLSGFTSRNSGFAEDLLPPSELKYLGHNRIELLKKVEELMHQVRELPLQSVDPRRGSPYINRRPARQPNFWSGEKVHTAHHLLQTQPGQLRDTCVQCFSHNPSNSNEVYRDNPLRTCYGSHNVGSSHDHTASSNSPYYDHAPKLDQENSKNKMSVPKRRCLPVAGGAPFIICFKCFKLLMLPAYFLPSSRSLQKLRCGACSEINVYQSSKETTDSPLKFEDHTDPKPDKVDPISFSDDYRFSSSNSYSTDPDSVLQVPYNSHAASEKSENALHHLFGYASARDILLQPSDDEGYESIWKGLVHSRPPSDGSFAGYEFDKEDKNSTRSRHSSGGYSSNSEERH